MSISQKLLKCKSAMISHHVFGASNIESPAEPPKSKRESGQNTPIPRFSGVQALVSNSGVVEHSF